MLRRSSTGAVTDSSRNASCYTWGWPDDGRLGLGESLGTYHPSTPKADIHSHPKGVGLQCHPHPNMCFSSSTQDVVIAAAGGGRHTLFLNGAGKVLASGWNKHGQLGNDPAKTVYEGNKNFGVYHPIQVQVRERRSCVGMNSALVVLDERTREARRGARLKSALLDRP